MTTVQRIKLHLEQGDLTHAEIAHACGVSRSRVTQVANEGKEPQKQTRLSPSVWHELLKQYPGKTVSQLARDYGVSRAAIYRRL